MDSFFSTLKWPLLLTLALKLSGCGILESGSSDEDASIASEINEASESISNDESSSSSDENNFSSNDSNEKEQDPSSSESATNEDTDTENTSQEVAENDENKNNKDDASNEFKDDEFSDEEFNQSDGENSDEIAQGNDDNFDDFNEFDDNKKEDENPQRELAQNEEPTLEGLDDKSAQALNEPPLENNNSDENAPSQEPSYPDATVDNAKDLAAPPPQISESAESTETANNPEEDQNKDESKSLGYIPVKKIKSEPFYRNGHLLNSVYIVRKDTDLASISKKIFGDNRSQTLLADNPHLSKGLKTGDKIYYNSPHRPKDASTMKVAYDDIGEVAQEYMTQAGDNIRVFSSKLLGFPEAWKEVWATNANVESKGEVDAGMSLRYWKDDINSLNTKLAGQPSEPDLDTAANDPAQEFNSDFRSQGNPKDQMGKMGNSTNVPPPPPPSFGTAETNPMNPPPPQNDTIPPPPPPALPSQPELPKAHEIAADKSGGMSALGGLANTDSTTLIYVALGLVAAVALFIRRKKSASAPNVFETTQV